MSKNLQKVQDMLDGNFQPKIQVGEYSVGRDDKQRKVGEKWTDSDGVQWEQKNGYRSKISNVNVGIFPYQCKDCQKNCGLLQVDKDTYKRQQRCYH